jgi:Domain of unknown function (DUF397)
MQHAGRDTGWFTSSHSGACNGTCVEVRLTDTATGVRDSKNRLGPAFTLAPAAWHGLLTATKSGHFDQH